MGRLREIVFGIRSIIDFDVQTLRLDARKLNTRAVNWYRKIGFKDDPSAIEHENLREELYGFSMDF